MRSGRALARTNGVTSDDGRCRMSSLTDRHACRSLRRERDGDCGRPRRLNFYKNCYDGGESKTRYAQSSTETVESTRGYHLNRLLRVAHGLHLFQTHPQVAQRHRRF